MLLDISFVHDGDSPAFVLTCVFEGEPRNSSARLLSYKLYALHHSVNDLRVEYATGKQEAQIQCVYIYST